MLEMVGGFGIVCITILQGANLWQGRQLNNKMDLMVNKDLCDERRGTCKKSLNKEIHRVNQKVNHHGHNGVGVKFVPIDREPEK